MELSLFLAKMIGSGLALVALSMLLNRKHINLLFDAYKHPSVVYITGFLETFLGIALVTSHNIWTPDFRVVITLIGWTLLLRGVGRLFVPSQIPHLLNRFRTMQAFFTPILFALFLLGVYLAYAGFTG